MNLLPKRNLWIIKGVKVVRMISTTGQNCCTGSDGSFASSGCPSIDSIKKPVDTKEKVIETMACVESHSLPASEGNPGMPSTVKTITKPKDAGKEAGEFLTRYYGDQVTYFKNITKVNKVAMKRIKKLRRDWLKFCEKNF